MEISDIFHKHNTIAAVYLEEVCESLYPLRSQLQLDRYENKKFKRLCFGR